jgi:hypothetical protein
MTPEFRRAILMWNKDSMKEGNEDDCIPLQLQKLFGQLQLSNNKYLDTVALTRFSIYFLTFLFIFGCNHLFFNIYSPLRSFGWYNSEVFQQQDVQVRNKQ